MYRWTLQQTNRDAPVCRASLADPEVHSWTLCHFTDLFINPCSRFGNTMNLYELIIRHSRQSLFVFKGEATQHPLWHHFHLSRWTSNSLRNNVGDYSGQCLSFYTRELQAALLLPSQTDVTICGPTRRRSRSDWLSWCFCPMCSSWWESRPPCFHSSGGREGER